MRIKPREAFFMPPIPTWVCIVRNPDKPSREEKVVPPKCIVQISWGRFLVDELGWGARGRCAIDI
jgi:hypothetical protein